MRRQATLNVKVLIVMAFITAILAIFSFAAPAGADPNTDNDTTPFDHGPTVRSLPQEDIATPTNRPEPTLDSVEEPTESSGAPEEDASTNTTPGVTNGEGLGDATGALAHDIDGSAASQASADAAAGSQPLISSTILWMIAIVAVILFIAIVITVSSIMIQRSARQAFSFTSPDNED